MAEVKDGYYWWRSQYGAAWKVVRVRNGHIHRFSAPPIKVTPECGEFGDRIVEPPR